MTHSYLLIAVLPGSPAPYLRYRYLKSTQKNFQRRLYSYVLNSRVTEPNLTKFLQGVQKWLLITLLWSSNPFGNANLTNKDRVKLGANHGKNCAFQQCKLWDCWTEVHQIWIRCSLIIAIEPFESGFTISESIVECWSKE